MLRRKRPCRFIGKWTLLACCHCTATEHTDAPVIYLLLLLPPLLPYCCCCRFCYTLVFALPLLLLLVHVDAVLRNTSIYQVYQVPGMFFFPSAFTGSRFLNRARATVPIQRSPLSTYKNAQSHLRCLEKRFELKRRKIRYCCPGSWDARPIGPVRVSTICKEGALI